MLKFNNLLITLIICLTSTISGCTIAMLGSMATQQSGSYELKVPEIGAKKDILLVAEQVGKDLGYKVSGKAEHNITFKYETNFIVGMALGSMRMYHIMVMKGINVHTAKGIEDKDVREKIEKMQKDLTITVIAVGDYGAGGVKHAEKLANEFKDKLLQRVI